MSLFKKFDPKALIFLAVLGVVGWYVYQLRVENEANPGDYNVKVANYRLEDGLYDEAIDEFKVALDKNPDHPGAHLGLAITYMQQNNYNLALHEFKRTIELAPDMAVAYADLGILYDKNGEYEKALQNYRHALKLDAEMVEGPGLLWRFLKNVPEKPPGIKERADYLAGELEKPPAERLLRVPEVDEKQRMYKID